MLTTSDSPQKPAEAGRLQPRVPVSMGLDPASAHQDKRMPCAFG